MVKMVRGIGLVLVAGVVAAVGVPSAAFAASDGAVTLVDSKDVEVTAGNVTSPYVRIAEALTCPGDATRYAYFLSAKGEERNPGAWATRASTAPGLSSGSTIPTALLWVLNDFERRNTALLPSLVADGGAYSVGVACLTGSPTAFTLASSGVFYTEIVVAPGGSWSLAPQVEVPAAPAAPVVAPGIESLSVEWQAPAEDGGAPIDAYTVTVYAADGATVVTSREVTDLSNLSTTFSGLQGATQYQVTVAAHNSAGYGPASASTTATTGATCAITYTVHGTWPGGFISQLWIANTGTAPINGWTLEWDFGGNQTVQNAWSTSLVQVGPHVTATDLGWNAHIGVGQSQAVTFGFVGATDSGANPTPTGFTLNGSTCAVA